MVDRTTRLRTPPRWMAVLPLLGAAAWASPARADTVTVTTTADAGPGSLRQAFLDLAASPRCVGPGAATPSPAGTHAIEFRIATAPNGIGGNAGSHVIQLLSALPAMPCSGTSIEGGTQTTRVGNSNPGDAAPARTVGTTATPLRAVARPEIVIDLNAVSQINFGAENQGLVDVAVYGASHTPYAIQMPFLNGEIKRCVVGAFADGSMPPAASQISYGGVVARGNQIVLINSLFSFAPYAAVLVGSTGNRIEQNHFVSLGTLYGNHANDADVISMQASGFILNNYFARFGSSSMFPVGDGYGVELLANNTTISGNTFDGMPAGGIGVLGSSSRARIAENIIRNSLGTSTNPAGRGGIVMEGTGAAQNVITQNSIQDNVGLGIALRPAAVLANDGMVVLPAANNNHIDYPVITYANVGGTVLTLAGYVGTGTGSAAFARSTLEFFCADNDGDNNGPITTSDTFSVPHGEGAIYLGTLTADANGRFNGTLPYTSPCASGTVTATATMSTAPDNYGTSEFGPSALIGGLGVSLSFSGPVAPGGTSTLTITLRNPTDVPVQGVNLVDLLPAGVTVAGTPMLATTCGGTPTASGSRVGLTGGNVAAMGSCTITLVVVAPTTPGMYTNTIPGLPSTLPIDNSGGGVFGTGGVTTGPASGTLTVTGCTDSSPTGTDMGCTSGSPHCRTTGAGAPRCEPCLDNASSGADLGCSGSTPYCIAGTSGSNVCVACTAAADCNDSNACTIDACSATNTCSNTAVAAGSPGMCASGLVCSGAPMNTCIPTPPSIVTPAEGSATGDTTPEITGMCTGTATVTLREGGSVVCTAMCTGGSYRCEPTAPLSVGPHAITASQTLGGAMSLSSPVRNFTVVACVDSASGTMTDDGCTSTAPICVGSGTAAARCQPCQDSTTAGTDLGCAATSPACETGTSGANICLPCEDSAMGTGLDNGCSAGTPLCTTGTSGARTCVQCTLDSHCMAGTVCGATNTCVPGCTRDADCAALPETPVCNIPRRTCVPCNTTPDCDGTEVCNANVCEQPDSDNDGIEDDTDLDDDNDGIPDTSELPTGLPADADRDGILDFQDPTSQPAGFDCRANANGVCTVLPATADFDQDGIANHLDLDADGDGLLDAVEGGGRAAPDGTIAGFSDLNGNGLSDSLESSPLPLPNSDTSGGPDYLDLDSDADGMTDTFEGGGTDANGDGRPDSGTDADRDGVLDGLVGAGQLPAPDTNDDGAPDYRDVDSDGDGITDAIEGTDTNHDGAPEIRPSGMDTDNDGLDNAFDPDCTTASPCGTTVGALPSTPDLDADGVDDFRDLDSDGDGIEDGEECGEGTCVDSDDDGEPDYLDLDSDDDGLPDASEGFDDDHDGAPDTTPSGEDTDGDGLDDAFDPDCATAAACGGVIGESAPVPDLDMDGDEDYRDADDDADGIPTDVEIEDGDAYEGPAADGTDVDGDNLPNWYDTDSDGDRAPDMSEESRPDEDGDLDDNDILDYLDPNFAPTDTDRDGVPDLVECPAAAGADCPDSDGDGSPDFDDADDDNDGIPTREEQLAGPDSDGDGIPNRLDLDSDNDGITDLREQNPDDVDANNDGVIDSPLDADMDGIDREFDTNDADPAVGFPAREVALDTDDDGRMDAVDLDSDADGLFDLVEGNATSRRGTLPYDTNNNGVVDGEADADDDGILDAVDAANRLGVPDTDGDGAADFQDTDDDGDGVHTRFEGPDADRNGYPNDALDTDTDGTPNYLDTDDDGDGIHTRFEAPDPNMDGDPRDARNTNVGGPDADTVPDYLDTDDDGDGRPTAEEGADPNGDHNPADAVDTDGDGTRDYLDPDGGAPEGSLAGGACGCTVNTSQSNGGFVVMLGLLGAALARRRRKAA